MNHRLGQIAPALLLPLALTAGCGGSDAGGSAAPTTTLPSATTPATTPATSSVPTTDPASPTSPAGPSQPIKVPALSPGSSSCSEVTGAVVALTQLRVTSPLTVTSGALTGADRALRTGVSFTAAVPKGAVSVGGAVKGTAPTGQVARVTGWADHERIGRAVLDPGTYTLFTRLTVGGQGGRYTGVEVGYRTAAGASGTVDIPTDQRLVKHC